MTAALKSRDGQLVTAERQLQGLQEADANDKQSLADIIANLRGALDFLFFMKDPLQCMILTSCCKFL